jgi:hypothetical protein
LSFFSMRIAHEAQVIPLICRSTSADIRYSTSS